MPDMDDRLEEEPQDEGLDEAPEDGGWSIGTFIAGLAVGALIGAGVGMLMAPDRGAKTRRRLGKQFGSLRERAEEGWEELRDETRREFQRRKRKLQEGFDQAARVAGQALDEARKRV